MFRPFVLPALLSAIGATTALHAADVAAEAPPLVLTIPSGAALATAWDTSLYGRLWQEPALSGLRDLTTRWLTDAGQRTGIAPATLLRGSRRMTAQVSGLERDADGHVQPQAVVTLDLGVGCVAGAA